MQYWHPRWERLVILRRRYGKEGAVLVHKDVGGDRILMWKGCSRLGQRRVCGFVRRPSDAAVLKLSMA